VKNVTISLDEGLLKAARLAAAKEGVSFQEYVRRLLRKEAEFDPVKNLEEYFAFIDKLNIKTDGKYPTREEIHDRPSLRRFERDPVHTRARSKQKKRAG
jgi:hypothetical protein